MPPPIRIEGTLKMVERQDRLGDPALPPQEHRGDDDGRRDHRQDERGAPPELAAADEGEQQARDADDEQAGAEVVDLVVVPLGLDVQDRAGDDERDDAQRDVDEEDPAPGELVDEEAAEQRPDDAGDGEDGAEVALVLAAVDRRDDVADDDEGEGHEPAAAEALDRPGADQLPHLLGEAGQQRADQEDDDREHVDRPAAVDVADLPVERGRGGRGEQVGGHDPRDVGDAAEVADDGRQRGGDDGLVERGEQRARHEPAQHDHDLAVGERLGHRRCSLRAGWSAEGVRSSARRSSRPISRPTVGGRPVPDRCAERRRALVEDGGRGRPRRPA